MNADLKPRARQAGYANGPVTKAPNWHGLVGWDMLFNNLAAGIFLVGGFCELLRPSEFLSVVNVGYPIALLFLVADLIFLVLDLGDPWRFHHMLRVIKLTSPMSLGTWALTVFGMPLTIVAALSFVAEEGLVLWWIRRAALLVGLFPALLAAVYKGVLFSTSSQPGWKDARWLGAYLSTSAILLGAAALLVLAIGMGQVNAAATLRVSVGLLLLPNAVSMSLLMFDFRDVLATPELRPSLGRLITLVFGVGVFGPLVLLYVNMPILWLLAAFLLLFNALMIRLEIVRVPHVFAHAHEAEESAPVVAGNGRAN